MHDQVWWKQLHWFEYGAELLGTAFLLLAGVSAVVFDFGSGSPLAAVLPDRNVRLLITGLLFAGSGSLVAISPLSSKYHLISSCSFLSMLFVAGIAMHLPALLGISLGMVAVSLVLHGWLVQQKFMMRQLLTQQSALSSETFGMKEIPPG
jgi:hypothetical protein